MICYTFGHRLKQKTADGNALKDLFWAYCAHYTVNCYLTHTKIENYDIIPITFYKVMEVCESCLNFCYATRTHINLAI